MTLTDYYESLDAAGKKELADALNSSVTTLSQIAHGHRRASPERAKAIEVATGGKVTAREIRPDLAELFGAA